MTDRICIHSNGANKFHLSAEDLLSCCDGCGFGCNGGYPEAAWNFFKKDGIVTGGQYNSKQGENKKAIPPQQVDFVKAGNGGGLRNLLSCSLNRSVTKWLLFLVTSGASSRTYRELNQY